MWLRLTTRLEHFLTHYHFDNPFLQLRKECGDAEGRGAALGEEGRVTATAVSPLSEGGWGRKGAGRLLPTCLSFHTETASPRSQSASLPGTG